MMANCSGPRRCVGEWDRAHPRPRRPRRLLGRQRRRHRGLVLGWALAAGLARAHIEDAAATCIPGRALRRRRLRQFRSPRAVGRSDAISSLTELFAPKIHKPTASPAGRRCTTRGSRPTAWPTSAAASRRRAIATWSTALEVALTLVRHARALQERALDDRSHFKLDILWTMNDAMALKYADVA